MKKQLEYLFKQKITWWIKHITFGFYDVCCCRDPHLFKWKWHWVGKAQGEQKLYPKILIKENREWTQEGKKITSLCMTIIVTGKGNCNIVQGNENKDLTFFTQHKIIRI